MTALRTATPVANGGNWRYSAARSEFESLVLNGVQRSVNRKVQVSNPWSGAKSELETDPMAREGFNSYILCTSESGALRTSLMLFCLAAPHGALGPHSLAG